MIVAEWAAGCIFVKEVFSEYKVAMKKKRGLGDGYNTGAKCGAMYEMQPRAIDRDTV
jgi:hypothetical protein